MTSSSPLYQVDELQRVCDAVMNSKGKDIIQTMGEFDRVCSGEAFRAIVDMLPDEVSEPGGNYAIRSVRAALNRLKEAGAAPPDKHTAMNLAEDRLRILSPENMRFLLRLVHSRRGLGVETP